MTQFIRIFMQRTDKLQVNKPSMILESPVNVSLENIHVLGYKDIDGNWRDISDVIISEESIHLTPISDERIIQLANLIGAEISPQILTKANKGAKKEAKLQAKKAKEEAKLQAKAEKKKAKIQAKAAKKEAKLQATAAKKEAKLQAEAAKKEAKLQATAAKKEAKLQAEAAKKELSYKLRQRRKI